MTPFITKRSLWLIAPPVAMALLDAGITLYGQSPNYWAGNYSAVNEGSPSFAGYLAIHPLCFVAASLVWVALFSSVILILPELLALCASAAVLLGHMWGTSTWLMYNLRSYQMTMFLMLATAVLLVLSFKKGQASDGRAAIDWRRTGLPAWTRWATIVALVALPVWWFLIPH